MTTSELITEIQNKSNKQADIIRLYAEAIHYHLDSDFCYDWHTINAAIMERWSKSGLKRIKREAWKRYENRY